MARNARLAFGKPAIYIPPDWTLVLLTALVFAFGVALLVTIGQLAVAVEETRVARAEAQFWQEFFDALTTEGDTPVKKQKDHSNTIDNAPAPTLRAAEFPALHMLQPPHPLEAVFKDALAQVQRGKGEARHGHGADFMTQTWLQTANAHGPAFLTGQAEKKSRESLALEYAQARNELIGSLVYTAMAVIKLDIDNGYGPGRKS